MSLTENDTPARWHSVRLTITSDYRPDHHLNEPAAQLNYRAHQMSVVHRNFLLRQIHYLPEAEAVEHRGHRWRLNYILEVATGQRNAAG